MELWEKRVRLEKIDQIFHSGYEMSLDQLYEGLCLCDELELDRAWVRYKAMIERKNGQQLELERTRVIY